MPLLRVCLKLSLVFVLAGCGGTSENPPPPPDHREIGPAGGTLTSRDSLVTVSFPAGAVLQPTLMSLVLDSTPIITDTTIGRQIGPGIKLSPEGLTFRQPVTIEMKLPAGFSSVEPVMLSPFDETEGLLIWQPSQLDAGATTVATTTIHFSFWVPWWAKRIRALPVGTYSYALGNCPRKLLGVGSTCTQVQEDVTRGVGLWLPLLSKSGIDIQPGPPSLGPTHVEVRFLPHSRILNDLHAPGNGPNLGGAAWALATWNRVILLNDDLDWYTTEAQAIADSSTAGHFSIERTVAHELGHHIGLHHIGVPGSATPCDVFTSPGVTPVMGYGHLGLPLPLSLGDLGCLALALPNSSGSSATSMAKHQWPPAPTVGPNSAIQPRPSVQVTTGGGQGVEGVTVVFEVQSGGGLTQGRVATTDAQGVATVPGWTSGGGATQQLIAYVAGLSPPTHTFTVGLAAGVSGDRLVSGNEHTCGLTATGVAYCWGENTYGQLGTGDFGVRSTPAPVQTQPGVFFVALAAGERHTCGLTPGGQAYCWGINNAGQLGDSTTTPRNTPVPVLGGNTFTQITAGTGHTCGIAAGGTAYCWGANGNGQLGPGPAQSQLVPVVVQGAPAFTEIVAGNQHSCGLAAGGSAYCWGYNVTGQLGDGTTTGRATPMPVTGSAVFTRLAAGGDHTCGITTAGNAYCWGSGRDGQLGNGSPTDQHSPTVVSVTGVFARLQTATFTTCGISSTGAALCWGSNLSGAVGDGTSSRRDSPVAVTGGHLFSQISPGGYHTCGTVSTGAAYCWGGNNRGQLGGGNIGGLNVLQPSPVAGGYLFAPAP